MNMTVDRIVEGIATCELGDKTMKHVSMISLPKGVKEGDILTKKENGQYYINKELRKEREEYIKTLADKLVDRASRAKKVR